MKSVLVRLLPVVLLLYVLLSATVFLMQEHLIFRFVTVSDDRQYGFQTPFEEVFLNRSDARLHGILFKAGPDARGLVIYFKGNGGHVGSSQGMAGQFIALGFDVLAVDYRGYGKSRGAVNEAALLSDAEAWYDWAAEGYESRDIRLVGFSLGTAFASHLAAVRPVDHVILFAPMKSALDMASRQFPFFPKFLARYPLRSDLKLQRSDAQILIYHGTLDRTIPLASGQGLVGVLGPDDQFRVIENAGHNDVPFQRDVRVHIAALWGLNP